jgi:hypothetical protein
VIWEYSGFIRGGGQDARTWLITQRSQVQILPPQPIKSESYDLMAAPTNSHKLPISKNVVQALAAIGLSTISTTLLFASLFEDDMACP